MMQTTRLQIGTVAFEITKHFFNPSPFLVMLDSLAV